MILHLLKFWTTTSDVKHGTALSAFNAPIDTISIRMVSAVRSHLYAKYSTKQLESAHNAIKVTPSSMEIVQTII